MIFKGSDTRSENGLRSIKWLWLMVGLIWKTLAENGPEISLTNQNRFFESKKKLFIKNTNLGLSIHILMQWFIFQKLTLWRHHYDSYRAIYNFIGCVNIILNGCNVNMISSKVKLSETVFNNNKTVNWGTYLREHICDDESFLYRTVGTLNRIVKIISLVSIVNLLLFRSILDISILMIFSKILFL